MKQILLKSLTLENFKGIGNQSINFDPGCTDIQGDNGTGKTTIADAFIWLLFGKDSEDRADFQIKTLVEGQPIPKIDHTVTGVFSINDMPITLSRCYREKWTKKRGAEDSEMTGHETVYTFNDVPCSEKDYKARIAEIISEQLFRAITNPFYFANLKWDNRRSVLIEMAGGVNDAEIAAGNEDFTKLLEILSGKPIEDFKKQLAAERKKIKDELDLIPARVDEVTKSIPDEPNYTVAEKQIEFFDKEIKTIDGCIADKSAISQEMLNKKQKQQKIIYWKFPFAGRTDLFISG